MARVQLYVYDLSKGLARQLSLSLIGKQIDGIWHTSVVVFDREVFYGRGIQITTPGESHHGQPLQVLDVGETALDEDTFDEYLMEMKTHYAAEKYHLLDFNCNSFTSDCVGFLTGGTIPPWIEDLPSDFLSTDFGHALRPVIDRMHSVPVAESGVSPNRNTYPVAESSSRSVQEGSVVSAILPPGPGLSSVVSPIHVSTNLASFHSILASHRAVVAFFTSATCGPCRFIEPTFEEIAEQKTRGMGPGFIAFVKVDIQVGAGYQLASQYSVTATPTFITFMDQQKKHEMRGVNASDLRTHVDMLLFEAFPPHPHLSLSLPRLEEVSTTPILFKTISSAEAVVTKLSHFIDSSQLPEEEKINIKHAISATILPFLKLQTQSTGKSPIKPLSTLPPMLTEWSNSSKLLISTFPVEQLFPIVDLWRMCFLNTVVGAWISEDVSAPSTTFGIISEFLKKTELKPLPRSFVLTLLKCFSNALSALPLSRRLLAPGPLREKLTDFATSQLLEKDDQIRATAASMVFNIASYTQVQRVEAGNRNFGPRVPADFDAEWEMEVVSAVIEGVRREENEEILHKLVASLGFLLRLSPAYEGQLSQLLEVFQVRKLLEEKASSVAERANVVELTLEVCTKLCP